MSSPSKSATAVWRSFTLTLLAICGIIVAFLGKVPEPFGAPVVITAGIVLWSVSRH